MRHAPRVVLDTNIVLSALMFARGRLSAVRHACHAGHCRPLVSRDTAAELMRALSYPKFGLTADEQRELLADYLVYCTAMRIPAKPPVTPACRDPFDVEFLRLAIAGKAGYLVTGDKDLLAIAQRFVCPIITAGEWLGKVGSDSNFG